MIELPVPTREYVVTIGGALHGELRENLWAYDDKAAAARAWSIVDSQAGQCADQFTVVRQTGTAIEALTYRAPASGTISASAEASVRLAARRLADKWAAPDGTLSFFDKAATGDQLTNAFFSLLRDAGTGSGISASSSASVARAHAIVAPFLDPAFQLIRADGARYLASNYAPLDIDRFDIQNVQSAKPMDDVVIARYTVATPGATSIDTNLVMDSAHRPRETAFHWDDAAGHWKLLSHANFNNPIGAICDQTSTRPVYNGTPSTSAANVALGKSLDDAFRTSGWAGHANDWMTPSFVSQLASGYGYVGKEHYTPGNAVVLQLGHDFSVTRNGRTLVVISWTSVPVTSPVDGASKESHQPMLSTWIQDDTGAWKVAGIAVFRPPTKVPATAQCVAATR